MQSVAPTEFRELLIARDKRVELVLVNGSSLTVDGVLSYYQFQLSEETDRAALQEFLLANDISRQGAREVIAALDAGVESDPGCRGDKQSCLVTPAGPLTVIVDSVRERVRLVLDKRLYAAESGRPEYVDGYNGNPAFINHAALYGSYFGGTTNLTLNDNSVLGLPYGHLRSRLLANSYDSRLDPEVDQLVYNLELDQYLFSAGRSRDFNNVNSTSLLNLNSIEKEGIYFGTSRNLARKAQEAYQRLYFYMPETGVIEVYRDDKLLFSQQAEAGQQFLSYDQLPAGTYSITLTLKAGERVLAEQTHAIVNTQDFKLTTGGWDFLLGAANARQEDGAQLLVGELDLVYRPWDTLMLGGGASWGGSDAVLRVGGKWLPNPDFNMNTMLGLFSDGARYGTLTTSYRNVTLSYQDYRTAPERWRTDDTMSGTDPVLSELLMGGGEGYQQLSLSGSYNLGPGNGYFSTFYQHSDDRGYDADDKNQNLSVNLGYNLPVWSANLGVNLGWSRPLGEGQDSDNLSLSLNWSLPLGEHTSATMNGQWDKAGGSSLIGSVRRDFELAEQSKASLEVGTGYRNRQLETTATGSLNYRGSGVDVSGSATTSARGENNLFASLSGTQIVSSQGIHFTTQQSDSYLVVRDQTSADTRPDESQGSSLGRLQVGHRGQYQSALDYTAHAGDQIVSLDNYRPYQVKLNAEGGRFYNQGTSDIRGFTYPGTVLPLTTAFGREWQLMGAFYHAGGDPVGKLSCVGEGCLQVDKLEEGLFKVRLRESGDFRLMAERQQCLASDEMPQDNARPLSSAPATTRASAQTESQCAIRLAPGETLYRRVQRWAVIEGLSVPEAVNRFVARNRQAYPGFDVTRIRPGQPLLCPSVPVAMAANADAATPTSLAAMPVAAPIGKDGLLRLPRVMCHLPQRGGEDQGPLLWSQQRIEPADDSVVRVPEPDEGLPQAAVHTGDCDALPGADGEPAVCRG